MDFVLNAGVAGVKVDPDFDFLGPSIRKVHTKS
jgi:hypothetical protein